MKLTIINHNVFTLRLLMAMFLCSVGFKALAQQANLDIRGIVYRKNVNVRLSAVLVTNMTTRASVFNDQLGAFAIKCSIGDTLLFEHQDVTSQKVAVTADVAIFVYMQPIVQLGEVEIRDVTKQQDMQNVLNDYRRQGVYNNGKTNVLQSVFSPVNALYDLFGSGAKQARHFQKYAAMEQVQTEIDRKFTKPLVKQCTGITDTLKLEQFMQVYRPTQAEVKKWTDYDLRAYIKKSYTDFEAGGEKKTLPKLVDPI